MLRGATMNVRGLAECLRRFAGERRGNLSMIVAVGALPLFMAASLTVDLGDAWRIRQGMEGALDAAALAALYEEGRGGGDADVVATAKRAFVANFTENNGVAVDVGTLQSNFHLTLVRGTQAATATASFGLDYTPVFLRHLPFRIARSSTAVRGVGSEACILALSKDAPRAIEVGGSAAVDVTGCTVTSDSTDPAALYVGGSATLKAECLYSAGGIDADPGKVDIACGKMVSNALPIGDPFAGRKLPTPGSSTDLSGCGGNRGCNAAGKAANDNAGGHSVTLQPGTYNGLEIKGNVELNPGYYLIDGGDLKLTAQSVVTGRGVTFFLLNGAAIDFHGGATFDISPAENGNWAGFSVVAAHGNTSPAVINGNSRSSMTGIVYLPDASSLRYSGNGSTSGECIRLIAQKIELTGNSDFTIDCSKEAAESALRNPTMAYLTR